MNKITAIRGLDATIGVNARTWKRVRAIVHDVIRWSGSVKKTTPDGTVYVMQPLFLVTKDNGIGVAAVAKEYLMRWHNRTVTGTNLVEFEGDFKTYYAQALALMPNEVAG